jgi:hypothetical protein
VVSENYRRIHSELTRKRNLENNPMKLESARLKSSLSHKGCIPWNKGTRKKKIKKDELIVSENSAKRMKLWMVNNAENHRKASVLGSRIAKRNERLRRFSEFGVGKPARRKFRRLFADPDVWKKPKRPGFFQSEDTKRRFKECMRIYYENPDARRRASEKQKLVCQLYSCEKIAEMSDRLSIAKKGVKFSDKARKNMSIAQAKRQMSGQQLKGRKYYEYRQCWFNSTWEVKVAKWLDERGIVWEYQKRLHKCSNGKCYIPDFHLVHIDEYIEVKGYLQEDDVEKMNDFVGAGHKLYIVDNSNIDCIELNKEWVV